MRIVVEVKTIAGNGKSEIISQDWVDVRFTRIKEPHFFEEVQSLVREVCHELSVPGEGRRAE